MRLDKRQTKSIFTLSHTLTKIHKKDAQITVDKTFKKKREREKSQLTFNILFFFLIYILPEYYWHLGMMHIQHTQSYVMLVRRLYELVSKISSAGSPDIVKIQSRQLCMYTVYVHLMSRINIIVCLNNSPFAVAPSVGSSKLIYTTHLHLSHPLGKISTQLLDLLMCLLMQHSWRASQAVIYLIFASEAPLNIRGEDYTSRGASNYLLTNTALTDLY